MIAFLTAVTWLCLLAIASGAAAAKQPNLVFILTDDQDLHMQSIEHMPLLQKYIADEGTAYSQHYCTVALCCPSRVNLWTGRAAHNTNVTDVSPPYGGYPKVVQENINNDYLPVWMQAAGYNTYYTGKLWNGHNITNYNKPYAKGFNGSDFFLDPTTYLYYNVSMSRNGAAPKSYEGQYSPDVIAQKTYEFLDEAANQTNPFFIVSAPIAPHAEFIYAQTGPTTYKLNETIAPKYAPRHAHLFTNYTIPRDSSFNPEQQGGVGWIADLPLLNDTVIAYNDEWQRARLRALQAVDEMIEGVVQRLESKGLLENTYVFFTTDNGYHISQHRMNPGKTCGYETDIHIPLIVRGPGIAKGKTLDAVSSHTDLAPTIMSLAGRSRDDFDGVPIPLYEGFSNTTKMEHVNVEFWGDSQAEGIYGADGFNNTYKSLRLVGANYSLYYSVWCSNEREYYDMQMDAGQIHNLLANSSIGLTSTHSINGRSINYILDRVDALMMVLKSCKAQSCVEPWSVLHPAGDVHTLSDALSGRFDSFYDSQPKVSFTACELGYIRAAEGPQNVNVFGSNYQGNSSQLSARFQS